MYNATLWYVLVTIVVMEAKNYVVCIVELHATVNNKKTCCKKTLYGEFISPVKINVLTSSCKVLHILVKF